MDAHVYKKIEVVGSSPKSVEEAIQNAIQKASQTVDTLRWFEVAEIRGDLQDGNIAHYQVTVKIGFRLHD